MEHLFFVKSEGIWWGPYSTFVDAQQFIHEWCDNIQHHIDNGTYSKDYSLNTDFDILEIPIANTTKVKYVRETSKSRVKTLEALTTH